jgi:hypothetical protein
MREIKFRAWDERKKIMHYNFQWMESGTDGNDWVVFKSDKQPIMSDAVKNPFFSQQLKKMQFTGLKDKSGKEIYEGDILTGATSYENNNDEREWTKEKPCVVEWYEECAGLNPFLLNARWRCDVIELGVIGNIYENPELLNQGEGSQRSIASKAQSELPKPETKS